VLLDAAVRHGVGPLVMASSAAVYDWWDSALSEDRTPTSATDVYSTTKIANEHQGKIWAAKTGDQVAMARIFNVIGHDDRNGHVIPDILQQVSRGGDVVQLGNTAPKRDYTHADDTAAGVVALLAHMHKGAAWEAYNISFGAEYSVVDLVAAIGEYLGRDLRIEHDPARVRKVDRVHLLGDTAKMRRVTGWRAEIEFHAALKKILAKLVPELAAA
jgi:UDP-glucose 4-epimerase